MEETVIVIMIKEKQSGFLEKELTSCVIHKYDELLLNAYATKEEDCIMICLKLTCGKDVSDWEFDAIFDHYDNDIYDEMVSSCKETADCYNPTWEFLFNYEEDTLEETINKLLEMHNNELLDVYEAIVPKQEEYEKDAEKLGN